MSRRCLKVVPLTLLALVAFAPVQTLVSEGPQSGLAHAQRVKAAKGAKGAKSAKAKSRKGFFERNGARVDGAMQKGGNKLRKGAQKARKGLRKGREAAGKGMRRARDGMARNFRRAGSAAGRAGRAVGRGLGRAGKAVGRGLTSTRKAIARGGNRILTAVRNAPRNAWNAAKFNLGMRASVKRSVANAKRKQRDGALAEAADAATGDSARPDVYNYKVVDKDGNKRDVVKKDRMGLRERFAMWRTRTSIKRTARKSLKRRAEGGDLAGMGDAEAALDKMAETGNMGFIGRLRANNAKRAQYRNAALKLTKTGQYGEAGEALSKAYGFTGKVNFLGRFKNQNAARKLYSGAFEAAKKAEQMGDSQARMELSNFAGDVAVMGKLRIKAWRHKARVSKMVRKVRRPRVDVLLKRAKEAYKAGEVGEAGFNLLLAKRIKVKHTRKQKRQLRDLHQTLGRENLNMVRAELGAKGELRKQLLSQVSEATGRDGASLGDFANLYAEQLMQQQKQQKQQQQGGAQHPMQQQQQAAAEAGAAEAGPPAEAGMAGGGQPAPAGAGL